MISASGFDYSKMFITEDALCDGTKWHVRTLPTDPALDPYFPIGRATLSLWAKDGELHVGMKTLTPNLKRYETQVDRGRWKPADDGFVWSLHPGLNRLEARTVNQFGVTGPVSKTEVAVAD